MYALDRAGWITGCTEFEDIVQSITSFDLPDEDFDPARYAVSYFMNNQYLTWGFNAGLANIFFHEAYHIMYGPAGGEHHAESIGDYCSGYRLYT